MAKDKIAYVCSNCGQESSKWMGKCPSCGQWNTFKEIRIAGDSGSQEAGQVLGMTNRQIFFKVTLLQMVKRIVPPMSNEIITLVKDTSLSRIIALQEIIWAGQAFLKGSQGISGAIWPLFFTGIYYLLFSGVLQLLLDGLEKKLDYFKA